MEHGIAISGQKKRRSGNNVIGARQLFAASPVNVIDSIVITEELDTSRILAEWIAYDPGITVYSDLNATQGAKLFINWSDRNGTVILRQGDYFTFVVPDIFVHDYIANITNAPITNEIGDIVATYSIYDNSSNMKEVKITFTDYVENHTNVYGVFWMLLYVGSVDSREQKELEFVINNNLVAQSEVTVNPNSGAYTPRDNKIGFSSPIVSADGYYIFEWLVYLNMGENAVNGFNTFEGFSFEDIIPADSPHVFLTNELRQELGMLPTDYVAEIGEYIGADSVPPGSRYQVFLNQYNSADGGNWYGSIQWHTLTSGLTTVGIGGIGGLHVTDIEVADKLFSANLGTITRPTVITFFTVSNIKISESALGDSEVAGLYKNIFKGSYGEDLSASLTVYRFEAGGSAQGITGNYNFSFSKVNEKDAVLPGAMFSLFTSDDFTVGADRFVFSGDDGIVTFNHLPIGTFYFQETTPPYGYLPNSTIYKVVLTREGFEIYYGANFENRLSDLNNKVINESEFAIQPVLVILPGRKNLTGNPLGRGVFHFIVKDNGGNIIATGINNADGSIQFSSIEFDEPGVYTFTVEEVKGADDGTIYDGSIFTVIVTVTNDGNGNLVAEVAYPVGGIVFNNRYAITPASVMLAGRKNLTGTSLVGGMFNFVVKDMGGNIVATGTNNTNGNIIFSSIEFNESGIYTFTVEEVRGSSTGIIYDSSIFAVTVTVTNNGSGILTAAATYPAGGIGFNNSYAEKRCLCCMPCCRSCCTPCPIPCCKPHCGHARVKCNIEK